MSFEEDWARARSAAMVSTRLNGWDEEPGTERGLPAGSGAASDLDVSTTVLRGLARRAGALHGRTGTTLTDLETSHQGLGAATQGLTSTAALERVRAGWEGRLGDVRRECARLRSAFSAAAVAHDTNEVDTEAEFSSMRTQPTSRITEWAR